MRSSASTHLLHEDGRRVPGLIRREEPHGARGRGQPAPGRPAFEVVVRQMVESAHADLVRQRSASPSVSVDNWRGKMSDARRAPTFRRRRFAHAFIPTRVQHGTTSLRISRLMKNTSHKASRALSRARITVAPPSHHPRRRLQVHVEHRLLRLRERPPRLGGVSPPSTRIESSPRRPSPRMRSNIASRSAETIFPARRSSTAAHIEIADALIAAPSLRFARPWPTRTSRRAWCPRRPSACRRPGGSRRWTRSWSG